MPVAADVVLASGVRLHGESLINLYGCQIGEDTSIGPFVEIQKNATIGRRCKISSHSFICEGVAIDDEAMIAHGVMFTNDLYPKATRGDGDLLRDGDWRVVPTHVGRRASIGSNATIIAGVTIGHDALVGAGAVVTRDVPPYAIVAGTPARIIGDVRRRSARADMEPVR